MAKAKRGLGKGLGALIPQDVPEKKESSGVSQKSRKSTDQIVELDINEIMPNKNQPRRHFDKTKLKALEDSITTHGVVQPIVVKELDKGYEIVAGERRWRASKNAGLKSITAVIRSLDDLQQAQVALIENVQREDLNDIEEALAYESLISEHALTQQDVAKAVGKSRTYITNTLRLLKLDEALQKFVMDGDLSGGHGRALLGLEDEKMRAQLAEKVITESLSVRETERLVARAKQVKNTVVSRDVKDSFIIEFESDLQSVFGTKVNIKQGRKKGRIEIEYYNDEDLSRLIQMLKK
ncbi:ParB/RepB/Spo0J family partition protein [Fusibacter sp. JL216-2]|uniref:ParB/RepB/Spo0J family partition protein n=1 Tax=Fusibacter sp. JL216-2 TaxID=3071453 RepID=UPI003D326217